VLQVLNQAVAQPQAPIKPLAVILASSVAHNVSVDTRAILAIAWLAGTSIVIPTVEAASVLFLVSRGTILAMRRKYRRPRAAHCRSGCWSLVGRKRARTSSYVSSASTSQKFGTCSSRSMMPSGRPSSSIFRLTNFAKQPTTAGCLVFGNNLRTERNKYHG
jgi:hypothetical protein